MFIKKFFPIHDKCGKEVTIKYYYLTSNNEILMRGFCPECKETNIDVWLCLDTLKSNCPPPPMDFNLMDEVQLHGLGVKLPETKELQ